MKFSDVIGQEELKSRLRESVASGRISHAQLFSGAAGYGTLPLALAYVQYINCEARTSDDSCGACASCRQIEALAHPDLHFALPVNRQGKKSGETPLTDDFLALWRGVVAQNRGYVSAQTWYKALDLGKSLKGVITAKEADKIVEKLSLKSYSQGYKTMIIWLPEMMNEQASNKILKILEEPWQRTLFILISERGDKLLPTIISRTQEVSVPRISNEDLADYAVKRGVEADTAQKIARYACGDSIKVDEIIAGERGEEQATAFGLFCALMRLSYNDKHLELVAWAEDVARLSRENQLSFLSHTARLLREAYVRHAGLSEISYIWGEEAEFCNKFAPFIGNQNIELLISEVETATRQIFQNGNSTIVFTHFALVVSKQINRL
ncbi:MAG: DNA polymerase III subunit delta [Rikenellaceae bacterium]